MIKYFDIPHHSPEWHAFRENGIGSSEAASVLRMNKYKPKVTLYYEKIREIEPSKRDSESMFHGREMEGYILNLWQYYDGEKYDFERDRNLPIEQRQGYIERFKAGNKFRTLTPNSKYAVNDKYPWLFDSTDAMAHAGQLMMTGEGTVCPTPFPVEAKMISDRVSREWEIGIPPSYLVQAHVHMIVHESDYAEIVILRDGRFLEVLPVPRNEQLAQLIIEETKKFWEIVMAVRKAVAKKRFAEINKDETMVEQMETIIQKYEPEPEPGEAYKEFKTERYKRGADEIVVGTISDLQNALFYKSMSFLLKEAEDRRSLSQNKLLKRLVDAGVERIEFPGGGYVRIYTKSNSKQPIVDVRPAVREDKAAINRLIEDSKHTLFDAK